MNLKQRIDILVELGKYILSDDPDWQAAQDKAHAENGWFTPEFIRLSVQSIARQFLQREKLENWVEQYDLANRQPVAGSNRPPLTVGLVMAGNIPLVGFHDFLTIFISGHRQRIKPSSRDQALLKQVIAYMVSLEKEMGAFVELAERLNDCDAYIATGSNNSARYFDYYFGKYPHVIRRNRTSVAVLNGKETPVQLGALADDVQQYFGLGCRNVTKLYVPEKYDFLPLLEALKRYDRLADYAKYKHNYDFQLTMLILNKRYYMSNESILLAEDKSVFSPISVLHYEFYPPLPSLADNPEVQCVVSEGTIPFGSAQQPELTDYADGVDTLGFLLGLGPDCAI